MIRISESIRLSLARSSTVWGKFCDCSKVPKHTSQIGIFTTPMASGNGFNISKLSSAESKLHLEASIVSSRHGETFRKQPPQTKVVADFPKNFLMKLISFKFPPTNRLEKSECLSEGGHVLIFRFFEGQIHPERLKWSTGNVKSLTQPSFRTQTYWLPLDPKTMKNEGLKACIYIHL